VGFTEKTVIAGAGGIFLAAFLEEGAATGAGLAAALRIGVGATTTSPNRRLSPKASLGLSEETLDARDGVSISAKESGVRKAEAGAGGAGAKTTAGSNVAAAASQRDWSKRSAGREASVGVRSVIKEEEQAESLTNWWGNEEMSKRTGEAS
jgi:hypothetical protein